MNEFVYVVSLAGKHVFHNWSTQCVIKNMNCIMPRTFFNGHQFQCPYCGWISKFPEDFIKRYKEKWQK